MVEVAGDTVVALLGDIGGTNVRFTLKRLNLKSRTSETILPLKKYESQQLPAITDAITDFISKASVSTLITNLISERINLKSALLEWLVRWKTTVSKSPTFPTGRYSTAKRLGNSFATLSRLISSMTSHQLACK